MKHANAENVALLAKGFISAYLHTGEGLAFVPLSDQEGHGYWSIPRSSLISEQHGKNLIVSRASVLMAKRMRPTTWGSGITHLEVGTGVGTGTASNPQPESLTQTALRVPLARKAITSWTNLLADGATPTSNDTNILQYTTNFLENEANGALVEMGLFGGDATATLGSGFMFNYKTFPALNKNSSIQLSLVWTITF